MRRGCVAASALLRCSRPDHHHQRHHHHDGGDGKIKMMMMMMMFMMFMMFMMLVLAMYVGNPTLEGTLRRCFREKRP